MNDTTEPEDGARDDGAHLHFELDTSEPWMREANQQIVRQCRIRVETMRHTSEAEGIRISDAGGNPRVTLTGREAVALEIWTQAQNDARLGRWRDPSRPHLVVYPDPILGRNGLPQRVRVVDEVTAIVRVCTTDDLNTKRASNEMGEMGEAAAAYYEHVAPAWHHAVVGEIWDVDVPTRNNKKGMRAIVVKPQNRGRLRFHFSNGDEILITSPEIRSARLVLDACELALDAYEEE